jgi:serine/threonine protein kinase
MTPERWPDVERILLVALTRDADEREAFVAEVCANDAALRREVESLLRQESEAAGFLSAPAAAVIGSAMNNGTFIGRHVGPYTIQEQLGAGGMGQVYRARDTKLNRDVAIKILPPVYTRDTERLARFEREARMLAALNHPHIGAIYGLEHADDTPALVLELIEGPTLAERLTNGPLPITEALGIAIQIAEALEAAHARGIVHRDLKPANIKITAAGTAKLIDFGLAKGLGAGGIDERSAAVIGGTRSGMSRPGALLGTAAYMSPEQAKGEPVDARTDLFSLGAVLYEMVTGRPAFAGAESTVTRESIVHGTPSSPRQVNPRLPRTLDRIICRLLMKDRDMRYQAASEVAVELKRLKHEIEARKSTKDNLSNRRRHATAGAALILAIGIAAWMWPRPMTTQAPAGGDYTQVTHLADSATSPSLSPDGRLMTFIRGESTFEGLGQIYLKALPDGEPVQLTDDSLKKMSPIFSPDGSQIAYTTVGDNFAWDTWVVPARGGKPRLWFANASGLSWIDERQVLFSEITTGVHMKVVAADDQRRRVRSIYAPEPERAMAHRSYSSPDGKWVLIVEMDQAAWQPCRLVPLDGQSTGRKVGPDGQCTSAAWSPDGSWMYFSSNSTGSFHIWRQRFPDGKPEQITAGPDEEEGIALAPDGRSLLTSIGTRHSSIWLRDPRGEREISREGYAFVPGFPDSGISQPFSPDGRSLVYLVRQGAVRFAGPGERAGELWITDLVTARSESVVPGVRVIGYEISRDGKQVVFAALDEHGTSHIWLAPLDRRFPPRQLAALEADSPHFGADGDILCRGTDRGSNFIYRLKNDRPPEKAVARAILFFLSVSPDGTWLIARVPDPGKSLHQTTLAFSTLGGPVPVCETCEVDWTPNAKSLIVRLTSAGERTSSRTFVIPLRPGHTLPLLPADGIRSEADLAGLPISLALDGFVYPGDTPSLYAFVRRTVVRNIYRVPLS